MTESEQYRKKRLAYDEWKNLVTVVGNVNENQERVNQTIGNHT